MSTGESSYKSMKQSPESRAEPLLSTCKTESLVLLADSCSILLCPAFTWFEYIASSVGYETLLPAH